MSQNIHSPEAMRKTKPLIRLYYPNIRNRNRDWNKISLHKQYQDSCRSVTSISLCSPVK